MNEVSFVAPDFVSSVMFKNFEQGLNLVKLKWRTVCASTIGFTFLQFTEAIVFACEKAYCDRRCSALCLKPYITDISLLERRRIKVIYFFSVFYHFSRLSP